MSAEQKISAADRERERRLTWFREARYGMFIHWGAYALIGRGEWAMNRERIPVPEYEALARSWQPKPGAARAWAKLAKAAGMRYMVLTTKHHDGFCLFESEVTDYNAVRYGPGRDLVAEYVEAARAEGLRVGLYYSLADWRHPDGVRCAKNEKARRRFVDYTHGLVRELCTNYGKIDILWYDGPWPLHAEGWESARMNAMARELQPDLLINDRSHVPEDFGTPEQHITRPRVGRAWEACMTLNENWGYYPADTNWKTPQQVVKMLVEVAAGGGNLLLNVGPDPAGKIPAPSVRTLKQVGEWLSRQGEAIYEATDLRITDWMYTGGFTCRGNTMYYTVWRWPGEELAIGGIQNEVLGVRFHQGKAIRFTQGEDRLVLRGLPAEAPEQPATVIEIEVKGTPRHALGQGAALLGREPTYAHIDL